MRRKGVRWIVVLSALLFLLPLHAHPAAARAGSPLTAVATSHGIRIKLSIPRRVYARDSLVLFSVTLTNLSRARRYLQDFQPDWGGPYSPHIVMRTAAGRIIYEEDLSRFLAPNPGTLGRNLVLRPGAGLTRHVRFVLEAGQVRAVSKVADGYTAYPGPPDALPRTVWARHLWHISTPWVRLPLRNEPAPRATVTRIANRIHVSVHAPWRTTGRLFYMDSARCGTMSVMQHIRWTRAVGSGFTTRVTQHCSSRQPWHAVAGWLGHRVLFLSYPNAARIP